MITAAPKVFGTSVFPASLLNLRKTASGKMINAANRGHRSAWLPFSPTFSRAHPATTAPGIQLAIQPSNLTPLLDPRKRASSRPRATAAGLVADQRLTGSHRERPLLNSSTTNLHSAYRWLGPEPGYRTAPHHVYQKPAAASQETSMGLPQKLIGPPRSPLLSRHDTS